jgi:hypothetical protein
MAEERCPKCGQTNPEGAKICRTCGAFLPALSSDSGQEEGGWLGDLRNQSQMSEPNPNTPSSDEDQENNIPEWLKRIRERSKTEQYYQTAGDASKPEDSEDLPDWMSGSESSPAAGDALPVENKPSQETTPQANEQNWMENLRSWQGTTGEQSPTQPASSSSEAAQPLLPSKEEAPEWLKSLDQIPAPTTPEPAPQIPLQGEPENQEGSPHWLKPFADEEPNLQQPDNKGDSDWLNSLRDNPGSQQSAPDAEKPKQQDWSHLAPTGPLSTKENPTENPSGHIPDWLKSFEEMPPDSESQAASSGTKPPLTPADEAPAGEIPDWLKAFEETPALNSSSQESTSEAAPTATPGETPDWLKAFEETPALNSSSQESTSEAAPTATPGETLDWLKAFQETPSAPQSVTSVFTEMTDGESSEKSSDKLKGEPEPQPPESTPVSAESAPSGIQIEPVSEEKTVQSSTTGGTPGSTEGTALDWLAELPQEKLPAQSNTEALSDWLSSVETSSDAFTLDQAEMSAAPEDAAVSPFLEHTPGWLGEIEPEPKEEKAPAEIAPLADAAAEQTIEEPPVELPKGQMPGWLEAMRPVEAVVLGEVTPIDERRVERAGPLAGLQGIIPSENVAAAYQKPPVYSSRVHLTEKQRVHVALLESMIAEEHQPQAPTTSYGAVSMVLLRVVLGLLLVLVILIPLVIGSPATLIPPAVGTQNITSFHTTVTGLAADSPVLLVSDYEASFAGEMRFAASSVVEEMMARGLPIAIVSSIPAGPVLADDLLNTAWSNLKKYNPKAAQAYSLDNRTANLGYLPGGTSSLQELALNPRQAAPIGWKAAQPGTSVWTTSPLLQPIHTLSNFSAVIVMTDSVETGRAWIEQVSAALAGRPLLLITSAQAAPLLEPYAASGQVRGMISGMTGGAAYERTAGLPGNGPAYWSAYQNGIFIAVIILIAGTLFQTFSGLARGRKSNQES